jgi:hypothetical protein
MGIEPTREVVPGLENTQFGTTVNAKCDGRVNFRGMWGHVGLRGDTRPATTGRHFVPRTSQICTTTTTKMHLAVSNPFLP